MTTISDYFEEAWLAQAAYAIGLEQNWFGGGTEEFPSLYAQKLIDGGMSKLQAIAFANEYTVVEQYTDPESGFSGTVFKDSFGQIFMAMRGTEPLSVFNDWPTNITKGTDLFIDFAIALF
ncbi:hypothetical protein SAMN05660420_03397 [Desulfuromusa kysingii]|uniref:Uncharacterized protein n=1 Tax=Desulfuromusa kysingii TaxID=37625 RepID=A0A1H4EIT8_9BACT|nr:hypothetical protein [Desulfuromusa kysingii]SEA84759.1 hypothetical protein SAMN05660420_03397 [Desulfuromusa kysingii]